MATVTESNAPVELVWQDTDETDEPSADEVA